MQRHKFDPISFFFGSVFVAVAVWILFVDDLSSLSARWVWPVLLILGGLAILASMFTQRRPAAPSDESAALATSDDLAEAAAELPDEPYFR